MSARAKQLNLLPPPSLVHGGDTREGKRKIARPFDPARPLHLILKSKRARGEWSMLHVRHRDRVEALTRSTASRFDITFDKIGYANVGTHLHLLVRAKSRTTMRAFIRALSGTIAMLITGTRKTHPLLGAFWEHLPYSRIVSWGRDLAAMRKYIIKNLFEAEGWLDRKGKDKDVVLLSTKELAEAAKRTSSPKPSQRAPQDRWAHTRASMRAQTVHRPRDRF